MVCFCTEKTKRPWESKRKFELDIFLVMFSEKLPQHLMCTPSTCSDPFWFLFLQMKFSWVIRLLSSYCSPACNSEWYTCEKSIQIILANNMELRHNRNCQKKKKIIQVSQIHVKTFSLVLVQSGKKHIMMLSDSHLSLCCMRKYVKFKI